MKSIDLTSNLSAIVDDDDFALLSSLKWRAKKNYSTYYAATGKKTVYMHRMLCDCPPGCVVDHINGNGLDNRRENLRCVSCSVNRLNSKHSSNNKSGFRGVCWDGRAKKWVAQISYRKDGVRKNTKLGYFDCPREGHAAYLVAVHSLFGCDALKR